MSANSNLFNTTKPRLLDSLIQEVTADEITTKLILLDSIVLEVTMGNPNRCA